MTGTPAGAPLLQLRGLQLGFRSADGLQPVLQGLDLTLHAGQTLGLVGRSGSGKSALAALLLGLSDPAAVVTAGQLRWRGQLLLDAPAVPATAARMQAAWQGLRGAQIGLVAQGAARALHPLRPIGAQLGAVLAHHQGLRGAAARAEALRLLTQVGLDEPAQRLAALPQQLSGGQAQRVLLALALAARPALLVADEPSTGLDTQTQAQVLDLLGQQCRQRGLALLLITHDLALAAQRCDAVAVLHQGRIVEQLPAARLGHDARHPHSRALLASAAGRPVQTGPVVLDQAAPAAAAPATTDDGLRVTDLQWHHPLPPQRVPWWTRSTPRWQPAADGVSLQLAPGQALGIVGASGSGKSSVLRLIARLADPQRGQVLWQGQDLTATPATQAATAPWRAQVQLLAQDATDSLAPHHSAAQAIAAPLRRLRGLAGPALQAAVQQAAADVGLDAGLLNRRPHQLSGGQAARVALARAIALQPALLLLDEPSAALDAVAQAQLLQRLEVLRRQRGLTLVLVSHDLRLVAGLCQQVAVMQQGRLVEIGPVAQLMQQPHHPATMALLQALPPPIPHTPA